MLLTITVPPRFTTQPEFPDMRLDVTVNAPWSFQMAPAELPVRVVLLTVVAEAKL